jgi:glycogen synthase
MENAAFAFADAKVGGQADVIYELFKALAEFRKRAAERDLDLTNGTGAYAIMPYYKAMAEKLGDRYPVEDMGIEIPIHFSGEYIEIIHVKKTEVDGVTVYMLERTEENPYLAQY